MRTGVIARGLVGVFTVAPRCFETAEGSDTELDLCFPRCYI